MGPWTLAKGIDLLPKGLIKVQFTQHFNFREITQLLDIQYVIKMLHIQSAHFEISVKKGKVEREQK